VLRLIPPAGTAADCALVARASKVLVSRNPGAGLASLAAHVNSRHVFGVSSGRAALSIILLALHRLNRKRDVIALPAYTCFSVPASIIRAGLKLRLIDVDPDTLDFDFSQLQASLDTDVLCVVTSNLFGWVSDVRRLHEVAGIHDVHIVDDAAQSFGALRQGQFSGTLGDVGFYSMGRGKPLAGEGGVIVTDSDDIAAHIREQLDLLRRPPWAYNATLLLQLMATAVFANPRLFWIPNSLPFLRLGATEFVPSFPMMDMAPVSRAVLELILGRVAGLNHERARNAGALAAALKGNPLFRVPTVGTHCQPNYLRLPVLASCQALRNQAVALLRRAGFGASPFYPKAICDLAGIQQYMAGGNVHCHRAEDLSRRLLTLPIHPSVKAADLRKMIEVFNNLETASGLGRQREIAPELVTHGFNPPTK
jgi:perosamine synthetase